MKTNENTLKKHQPELLVDFNGNPVGRAWMLGGKTITVSAGDSFIAETTLMRICNSGDSVARLKLLHADYSTLPARNTGDDEGLPILPNSVDFFGVYQEGQEYEVTGEDVDVTFVFDRRTDMTA